MHRLGGREVDLGLLEVAVDRRQHAEMVGDAALEGPRGEGELVGIRPQEPVEDGGARSIVQLGARLSGPQHRQHPDIVLGYD